MRRRRFDNRLTAIAGWAAMALLDGAGMARAAPPVATASVRGNTIISSVELESLGAGNRIDQILIELGRKPVQSSRPGVVPAGWQCTADGGAFRCSGAPVDRAYLSFEPVEVVRWPPSASLEVRGAGVVLLRTKVDLRTVPMPEVRDTLDDALVVPGSVTAGEPFLVSPVGDAYLGGGWRFQAGTGGWRDPLAPDADLEALADDDEPPSALTRALAEKRSRFRYELPKETVSGQPLRFRYQDPWGATLVDAPWTDWTLAPARAQPCEPELVACHPKVAVGAALCACGCFHDASTWSGLELDGKPLAALPLAGSSTTLSISTEGLAPGPHLLAFAGGRGRGSVEFEAVEVGGSIDRDKLMVGESTGLEFRVDGTRSVVPMDIRLRNGNVSIHGGNEQTAYTSGGAANRIQRTLHALGVGDFNIAFTIDLPPCPCGGDAQPPDHGEWTLHQFSPRGSAVGVFGSSGLRVPFDLSSDTVIARTPRPPFEAGQTIELDFRQLGLQISSRGLPAMTLQTKADTRSLGRLGDLRVDDAGTPTGGSLELDLRSEFSMPLDKRAPFEVGAEYTLSLEGLKLDVGFDFGRPGRFTIEPGAEGSRSSVALSNIQQDKAGKTLYGDARLELSGYRFERLSF